MVKRPKDNFQKRYPFELKGDLETHTHTAKNKEISKSNSKYSCIVSWWLWLEEVKARKNKTKMEVTGRKSALQNPQQCSPFSKAKEQFQS